MKSLASLLFLAVLSCCGESTEEKFFRECPYKNEYVGAFHQLQVPINVVPHKLKYQVGDTISFVVDMTDSIHDLNTEQKFKIENFPFKPVAILYRFYNETKWDDGFRKVKYLVDTSNFIRTDKNGNHPEALLLKYTYFNKSYRLKLSIVLNEKGKYIFQLADGINVIDRNSEEFRTIKAINFPGKCPTFGFNPIVNIVGDDQMSFFEKELIYIDKEEFFDEWRSNKTEFGWQNPYGEGGSVWEQHATFGFIVE